jgi:hypothetical protein
VACFECAGVTIIITLLAERSSARIHVVGRAGDSDGRRESANYANYANGLLVHRAIMVSVDGAGDEVVHEKHERSVGVVGRYGNGDKGGEAQTTIQQYCAATTAPDNCLSQRM